MWEDGYKHRGLRKKLVQKLVSKGIKNVRVLETIGLVPRHIFFDNAFLEKAYEDIAFPIGEGQTISQPFTVAFQTELLDIKYGDKVLEIGTGSGYQAWVLALMGAKLWTIERNEKLHLKSKKILGMAGVQAQCIWGDGTIGLSSYAPFDKIIVTAGAPIVPPKLIEQLDIGGILVIPVGNESSQRMKKITKLSDGNTKEETYEQFRFVPLIGQDGWKK